MRNVWRVTTLATILLAWQGPALAQTAEPKLEGLIHDYTAALDSAGPWQIVGEWSLGLKGATGKVDFFAALNMVRSDNAARQEHTHHITLTDADVFPLANGYRITGNASITSNGNAAPFTGSPIDIEITGGAAVPFANISVTFRGGAAGHFGAEPVNGVVTYRR